MVHTKKHTHTHIYTRTHKDTQYVWLQGVLKLFSKLQDRSGPVTLVKLQLGLVTDQTSVRSRLAELSGMIKVCVQM